jgi:inward rectifier potassium channel
MKKSRRKHRYPVVHIKIWDGRLQIDGLGAWYSYWRDPYHLMLTVPWWGFVLIILLTYLGASALFAILYMLQPGSIANANPSSYIDAFFFSVQTLATIGYGAMYPKTFYANSIVTVEAVFGLVGLALMTGLTFARFSRPTARVVFSQVAVIQAYDGELMLMFRSANKRRNQILEAQMRVYLLQDEVSAEGQSMRRFYDLRLTRQRTPSFTLTWTVMHPIDHQSPLHGLTAEALSQKKAVIVASLSGIDETVMQTIHARHTYAAQDILWNHRFVDIFYDTEDGHRYLDYNHFHHAEPVD